MTTEALRAMRVVEVGTAASGSYCARLLADFGADVVKIEDTAAGGDPTRRLGMPVTERDGAPGDSALFVYLNQNKRSVALDLRSERGRALSRRLILAADVVVDSGAPGGLADCGLTLEEIRHENPRAVVVSITAFGQDAPYRDRPACHLTIAALSGWLKVKPGPPEREPIDVGFPLLDYVAASVGALGAVAAWRAVRDGADGQLVDVSEQEVGVRMYLYPTIAARLGRLTGRQRPFPMYVQTSNGYVAVNALNAQHRQDAFVYMELFDEPDGLMSADAAERRAATEELQQRMDAWAADKTREEIFEVGQAMRIPVGIPYTLTEVVEEDHFRQRGFFRPLVTEAGEVLQPVGPFGPGAAREDWKDAPALGEDNAEVLERWLGTDDDSRTARSESLG